MESGSSDWFEQGNYGFLHAYRGTGKSWFIIEMTRALTTGTKFGPRDVHKKARVMYIDGEMPVAELQKRFQSLGVTNENFILLHHKLCFLNDGTILRLENKDIQKAITSNVSESAKIIYLL